MPRNKVLNDIDYVLKDLQLEKAPKEPPLKLKLLPKYKLLQITKLFTYGYGLLPNTTPNDPYTIFSLFFTESILEILVRHINKYTFLYSGPKKPYSRTQIPTTVSEFRAFLGVFIWMGLYIESGIKDFWNTDLLNRPIYY